MPISEADQERQRSVLPKLREAAGMTPTKAAGLIGVSYSQLLRYESGETILPTNYYQAIADTYGIRKSDLSVALGLVDDPPRGAEPLAELLREIGMPEDECRELLSSIGNAPTTPTERAAIAEFVASVLRKRGAKPEHQRRRA